MTVKEDLRDMWGSSLHSQDLLAGNDGTCAELVLTCRGEMLKAVFSTDVSPSFPTEPRSPGQPPRPTFIPRTLNITTPDTPELPDLQPVSRPIKSWRKNRQNPI